MSLTQGFTVISNNESEWPEPIFSDLTWQHKTDLESQNTFWK